MEWTERKMPGEKTVQGARLCRFLDELYHTLDPENDTAIQEGGPVISEA